MCLGIPVKIVEIKGDIAIVESEGVRREAVITFIDNPKVGDYVILHAGFAIQKIDEKEAKETLKLLKELEKWK